MLAFIIRIYHEALSSECQIGIYQLLYIQNTTGGTILYLPIYIYIYIQQLVFVNCSIYRVVHPDDEQ